MKKLLLIGVLFLLVANIAPGQVNAIAVQKDGVVNYYSNLNDAYNNAPSGADIILPGGTWYNPQQGWYVGLPYIQKEIHLYGAGFYPGYTSATAKTRILSQWLVFGQGSSNSTITGIEIDMLGIEGVVDNISISRFSGGLYINGGLVTNVKCTESFINFLCGGDAHNVIFEKNVITNIYCTGPCQSHPAYFLGDGNRNLDYAIFNHNIIICANDGYMFKNMRNSTFSNNIIIHDRTNPFTGSNNYFQNNLCTGNFNLPDGDNNFGQNNIYNYPLSDIFINYINPVIGGYLEDRFEHYSSDFHLKSTCTGKNYATDGTDVGIYGTSAPFKDGAIPILPHYLECNIPAQLDANGKLNISVTVEAQTK